MNLNILSASDTIGWYTYNQISDKKDIILNKVKSILLEVEKVNNSDSLKELKKNLPAIEDKWYDPVVKKNISWGIKVYNISNILGYLPIIGTIVGIAKLVFVTKVDKILSQLEIEMYQQMVNQTDQEKVIYKKLIFSALNDIQFFRNNFKVRAIIETASLGSLLLIPDLIVSIARSVRTGLLTNC